MAIAGKSFVQITTALLVVAFLALIGIVGMTYWLGERAQVYFNQAIEARDARGAAVDLRNSVQTAESSQRGFLYTGNEIYLAPYDTAKTLAQRQLDVVNRMSASYQGTAAAVQRLSTVITEKFNEMDQTISLKRDRRDAEALAAVRTNHGKALMDEANVYFSGIIRATDDRLTTGVEEQKANATWLRRFSIIGGMIIVLVIGAAAITVIRHTRELGVARDEVGILNVGLEERVRVRTADLAQANEDLQHFAHIITHDLRAPLVNIMGFTSELEGGVKSVQALLDAGDGGVAAPDPVVKEARIAATEDLPEAISFIRSSTKKMDSLINAILTLSREGRRALRSEPVVLAEVINTCSAAIQHQLSAANGEVKLDLAVPTIVSDKLSLEMIIGNLLDNAVKYRSKTRPLRIDVRAVSAPRDRVSIEVADNGRGIAAGDQERIFELFRRSGVQDQPGEGIGLAYVRTVVRNLGGEITVTSAVDRGTTFTIVLPRALKVSERMAS